MNTSVSESFANSTLVADDFDTSFLAAVSSTMGLATSVPTFGNRKRTAEQAGLDAHQDIVAFDEGSDNEDDGVKENGAKKTTGRKKIKIEYIDDKSKRHITFSKRKAGIMKKAYELATLTGTQVLLLVASETGHVYTFATKKFQPIISLDECKQLIQTCLNVNVPVSGPVDSSEEDQLSESSHHALSAVESYAAAMHHQQQQLEQHQHQLPHLQHPHQRRQQSPNNTSQPSSAASSRPATPNPTPVDSNSPAMTSHQRPTTTSVPTTATPSQSLNANDFLYDNQRAGNYDNLAAAATMAAGYPGYYYQQNQAAYDQLAAAKYYTPSTTPNLEKNN